MHFFSLQEEKVLNDTLSDYTDRGLPMLPQYLTKDHAVYEEQLFEIADHWTSIVQDSQVGTV